MASKQSFTASYEALDKVVKLILQFFFGWIIGGVYRILRFAEKGNVQTLVIGILCTFTGVGNVIAWVIDWYTEYTENKISVFAD